MIVLAHNCAVLGVNADTSRLFREPYGDYHLALTMTCEMVSETNRREQQRAESKVRK